MIDELKPYSAMKDSDVPWLGDVPKHWNVLPNRTIFAEVRESGYADQEMLSVTINQGVIRQSTLLSESSKKDSSNEDKSKYKLVSPGDITYNKMRAWQGAIGVSRFRGIVSPAYIVVRPRDRQEPEYFHYLLRTPAFATEAERWSYGISSDQWSLRPEQFKQIYCCVPPSSEQALIVRFLDHADWLIRRYVRAKQKLIAQLNEQKQAIIHRAVTRGLDPNVRLKRSGVEWLGEIPEHWEVVPLRRRWEIVDCKHLTVPFVEEGFPLASVREVQTFDLNLQTAKRTTSEWYAHLVSGGRAPKRGDLIFCRNVSVGACAHVNTDEPFALGQDVCLIRSQSENNRFLNYYLHSPTMGRQLALLLIGSTFDRINVGDIKALTVPLPPHHEQDEIAMRLDAELIAFEKPIRAITSEIALLQEYRTRLIADVVTGKLDVRAAAAALPDKADDAEALDEEIDDEVDEAGDVELADADD